jgi:hypothetical protein
MDTLMLTIVETEQFTKLWPDYWTEDEFGEFCAWLACHPDAGVVEPGTDGCRKVRWGLSGTGKSAGVRVIYFTQLENGELWLVTMYAKKERSTLPKKELRARRKGATKAR